MLVIVYENILPTTYKLAATNGNKVFNNKRIVDSIELDEGSH